MPVLDEIKALISAPAAAPRNITLRVPEPIMPAIMNSTSATAISASVGCALRYGKFAIIGKRYRVKIGVKIIADATAITGALVINIENLFSFSADFPFPITDMAEPMN